MNKKYIMPQYMGVSDLATLVGMSKQQVREAIYCSLAEGQIIGCIRPKSAKGLGHPRYKVADILRAWKYEHPLAVAEI